MKQLKMLTIKALMASLLTVGFLGATRATAATQMFATAAPVKSTKAVKRGVMCSACADKGLLEMSRQAKQRVKLSIAI